MLPFFIFIMSQNFLTDKCALYMYVHKGGIMNRNTQLKYFSHAKYLLTYMVTKYLDNWSNAHQGQIR